MAIIGKIRENSLLILIVVGLSLLLFILSDALSNNRSSEREEMGYVFGEPVDINDYNTRVSNMIDQETMNRQMQGLPSDETVNDQIRESVWNQVVRIMVYANETKKLPLSVSIDELNDLTHGVNLHPWVAQIQRFYGFDGKFSADSLAKYLQMIETAANSSDENMAAQGRKELENWANFEDEIMADRIRTKYDALIRGGMYVTNAEAKTEFNNNSRIYKIRYVVKKYFDLSDSLVTVTDEDIKAYYEKNKNRKQWEQPGSRTFEYVEFAIAPSAADKVAMKADMDRIANDFKTAPNDSAFVFGRAENPAYLDRFSADGEFTPEIDSLVMAADSGTVIGPYEQFGYMKVMKVRGTKMEPQARVRHILLSKEKGDMAALKKRADSIRVVIRKNKNFDEMVTTFTDDPGSRANGGVYEWFSEGRMVKPFEDASFKGKIGDLQIVETEYGVHLVEVLDRREVKRVKYSVVDKKIKASDATTDSIRANVVNFLEQIDTNANFEKIAQKNKLVVLENEVFTQQKTLNNTESTRELVRFVQNGEKDDVSSDITSGDRIVVAHILSVKKKGIPEFEDVKEMMTGPARQEKKAEYIRNVLKNAKTVDEASAALGVPVQEVEVNFASTTIRGGGGNEPKVIGTIFSLTEKDKGATTKPIQGRVGVYVVQLVEVVEAPQTTDYKMVKESMTNTQRGRASMDAYNALKEKADVQDNRQY
jgi:peptidyl-prolyl cis-trans isomerase D